MKPEIKAALLLTIVALFIMLSVHPVSAWFSLSDYKEYIPPTEDKKWGVIDIWNGNFLSGDNKVATHTLDDNTNSCFINCHAQGTTTLYEDGVLFDDVKFYNGNVKSNSIWLGHIEQETKTIIDYKKECANGNLLANGTLEQTCQNKEIGSHNETKNVFVKDIKYLGESLPMGNYVWRIEGIKNLYDDVEWIAELDMGDNVITLDEWASWNATFADGIVLYYNMSSNEELKKGIYNLTNYNAGPAFTSTGCLIGGCANYTSGIGSSITDSAGNIIEFRDSDGDKNATMNLWLKTSYDVGVETYPVIKWSGTYIIDYALHTDNSITLGSPMCGSGSIIMYPNIGGWNMLTIVTNVTDTIGYMNGTKIGSCPIGTYPTSAADAQIWHFGAGNYWEGLMDEFSWWNRSFDANEVAGLYNAGSGITYALLGYPISLVTNITTPANNINYTSGTSLNFNATLTPTNSNTTNATLYVRDSAGAIYRRNINTSVFNTTLSINVSFTNTSFADGNYTWNVEGCAVNSTASICAFAPSNFTFTLDSTPPVIAIIYPANNSNVTYQVVGTNLTLNFSITDSNGLSMCWYEYGGVNVTTSCSANASFNTTDYGTRTIKLYANDTFGNLNSTIHNWNYTIWQTALTYNSPVPMGSSQEFRLNITANPSPNAINFTYNSTTYQASFTTNANNYSASYTLVTPTINYSSMLIPFYWTIYSSNGNAYNSSTNNQNVTQITLDDCSTNTIVLYNFTIKDEADQSTLNATANSTSAKIDLQIYPVGSSSLFLQFNKTYNQTNPFAVCLNANLSNAQYSTTSVIEYKATGYQIEFYNIKNRKLNDSLLYQNISLYNLLTTSAQPFKLIVKDSSFLSIENAIIEVYRKYISEGVYKIVEIPKTDPTGETTASLVINDVIYKFIIKKFGHTISTVTDVRAICQNPSITTCQIDFNAFESGIDIPNYEQKEDFNFTLGYNKTSRVVTSRFLIPSGNPATIRLNVTIQDALGTQACSDTITSTTGTLTCTIPQTLGNMSAFAKIYRDGVLQSSGSISQSQTAADIYGSVQVFLALLIMLTLIGAAMSDNPIFTVLFFMAGVILLFGIHLVENTGFIGAGATILFLIVAIIIVIIKGARRS